MIENGIPDCSISALGYILEKEYGQSLETNYYFGHKFFCKEECGVVHISGTPFGNAKLSGKFLEDPLVNSIIESTSIGLEEDFLTSIDELITWLQGKLNKRELCFLPFVHSSISSRNDKRDIYHTLVVESYDIDKELYFCTDQTGDCWVTREELISGLAYIRKEFGSIRKLDVYQSDKSNLGMNCNLHNVESLGRQSLRDFVDPLVLFAEFLSRSEACNKIYSPRVWTFKQQRKSESLYLKDNDPCLYDFLEDVLKRLEKVWTILDMKILKHNTSASQTTRASVIESLNEIRRLEERYFSICENYYINS